MITDTLFRKLKDGWVIEGRESGPLMEIGGVRWRQHVGDYKQWTGIDLFGPPTATASLEDGLLLYALVRGVKPGIVVEIGTNQGFTAMMIAAALAENARGKLFTIDIEPYYTQKAIEHIHQVGLASMVVPICGKGSEALAKAILPNLRPPVYIDLLFEDGDHKLETILEELTVALPALAPDAYVVFHDTILLDEVKEAVEQVKALLGPCEELTLGTCRGLTILHRIPQGAV